MVPAWRLALPGWLCLSEAAAQVLCDRDQNCSGLISRFGLEEASVRHAAALFTPSQPIIASLVAGMAIFRGLGEVVRPSERN